MHNIIPIVLVFFVLIPSPKAAAQEDRRVEEQKREDLKPTEAQYYESQKSSFFRPKRVLNSFNQLELKETADQGDAVLIICALFNRAEELESFSQRKEFLMENGLLPSRKVEGLEEFKPIDRGLFAIMLFNALELKGGLTIRVFGISGRYAHLELVQENIMYPGSSSEFMSGRELIASFVNAADYLERKQAK